MISNARKSQRLRRAGSALGLTAAVGVGSWLVQATMASHYDRLTNADARIISAEGREYTDLQIATIRKDLHQIRQDLSHQQDLLIQILLEIQTP